MANPVFYHIQADNYPAPTARRSTQRAEMIKAIDFLVSRQAADACTQQKIIELERILRGIYQEACRLIRVDPALPLREIAPPHMQTFLKAAYDLMRADPSAEMLIPNSEKQVLSCRAQVVELRLMLDSLVQCSKRLEARGALLTDLLDQARTVSAALALAESGMGFVLYRDVKRSGIEPHPAWFVNSQRALAAFNFQKLNHLNIQQYFCKPA